MKHLFGVAKFDINCSSNLLECRLWLLLIFPHHFCYAKPKLILTPR